MVRSGSFVAAQTAFSSVAPHHRRRPGVRTVSRGLTTDRRKQTTVRQEPPLLTTELQIGGQLWRARLPTIACLSGLISRPQPAPCPGCAQARSRHAPSPSNKPQPALLTSSVSSAPSNPILTLS